MKAAVIEAFGDCDQLHYRTVPVPVAAVDHAVVQVFACGINRYDCFLRMGGIRRPTPLPHVMGADIAGMVVDINGPQHGLAVGQRVIVAPGFPLDRTDWGFQPDNLAPSYTVTGTSQWGGYAEYVSVPTCFLLPDETGLPPEEVATLPLVLVTAVHAVQTLGEVTRGQQVLIQAGASGSGSMCIQMARHIGARVITTVGGGDKIDFARRCGAERVVDHHHESFTVAVEDWTDGRGVDVVIDNVGGGIFKANLAALKPGGILVNFGLVGGVKDELNFAALIFKQHQVRGSMMGTRAELADGLALVRAGHLRPTLDRTFPLRDAAAAHAYVESRQVRGKVVLVP